MKLRVRALVVLFAAGVWAAPARAGEAPFDPGLRRLAEVMGALHFLSQLCGQPDRWRDDMGDLLRAEAPAGERNARLTASFNRGYQAFADTYRHCTPSARAAIALYVEEGGALSRQLADRYGN